MSLPHSSASSERTFSHLKLIKTSLRNKLCPDSICAVMQIDRYIPNVDSWDIPGSVIKAATNWKTRS